MRNDISSGDPVSLFFPRSRASTSANRTGTWSFFKPAYVERAAPCSAGCPCGEDIPRIEMLLARGLAKEAWQTVLMENPLPGTCGRVCFHPCEGSCNRSSFDEAVSINALERYLDDVAAAQAFPSPEVRQTEFQQTDEHLNPKLRVAIVGAGPAGLAAAWFARRLGFSVALFDQAEKAGGVLRYGIPRYRLPEEVLDREVRRILSLGIDFRASSRLDEADILRLTEEFDAVFISAGHGKPTELPIPGAELAKDGLAFLADMRRDTPRVSGRSAAVIGGGNTAIDVARSLRRLGKEVTIVYRRRVADMPAFAPEVARALEEGVKIEELLAPGRIARAAGKDALVLEAATMRPGGLQADGRVSVEPSGEPARELEFDEIYLAIGAQAAKSWMLPQEGAALLRTGRCSFSLAASGAPMLYGGDLVNETESVADAIASGKAAAIALHAWFAGGRENINAGLERSLSGEGAALSMERYLKGPRADRKTSVVKPEEIGFDYFNASPSRRGIALTPARALTGFDEVEATLENLEAIAQAARCFNCGICNDCDNCRTFCPEAAVSSSRATGESLGSGLGPERRVDPQYCKGCGICIEECPRGVMETEEPAL